MAAENSPFVRRHIGIDNGSEASMLETIGCKSRQQLIDEAVPSSIISEEGIAVGDGHSEEAAMTILREWAELNDTFVSLIGTGYYGTYTPAVIARSIFENPGWYTQYTPYQAEISQGRLEALVNFQTMVSDLTGLQLSNASLLDEATAAAEAMAMAHAITKHKRKVFWASTGLHPQSLAVLRTRAEPLNIDLRIAPEDEWSIDEQTIGVLVQYPATDGSISDYRSLAKQVHDAGAVLACATDLLALAVLTPPGEWGADIAIGSSQRFGVPMGFGGPHAAFLSTSEEYRRQVPGRIIGVSKDSHGDVAYRLALQTREQHIRRDRATSNICTAQVLLAIMAGTYAVYHGPEGLKEIAHRVRRLTNRAAAGARDLGLTVATQGPLFDTVRVQTSQKQRQEILARAKMRKLNLRQYQNGDVGASFDETSSEETVREFLEALGASSEVASSKAAAQVDSALPGWCARQSDYLRHPTFHRYQTEHELLRYLTRLQSKDISLTHSMIPLGSCTMKLNAAAEMASVSLPGFANIHPHAPAEQWTGYQKLLDDISAQLASITGFHSVSLQPNSGAQGEYAGLLCIRRYHLAAGDTQRTVCLVPTSAHGTNPASAVMAGFKVVGVKCDKHGNIDVADLRAKADKHKDSLGALMITYPSTHGVFESAIREICQVVHDAGGLVYMDGANLNAQVGICRPAEYGADVIHLNLHKTFCIPHGGGGPGMGPIGVTEQLAPYLPGDPLTGEGAVSAARFGSPSILPISWAYIAMMGSQGLRQATEVAILNANYMMERLKGHYNILYVGESGRVAHEFILDCRSFKQLAGITVDDIAKRLMDFGFHAPTMSWPVAGTLMVEPTESESKAELDRFCDAMIHIRGEIRAIEDGKWSQEDNPLVNAPHTSEEIALDEWPHAYTRMQAAYPEPWLKGRKYWPPVGRVDNVYGDRNLFCTCPPVESFED